MNDRMVDSHPNEPRCRVFLARYVCCRRQDNLKKSGRPRLMLVEHYKAVIEAPSNHARGNFRQNKW
jgi:hypothetical protein